MSKFRFTPGTCYKGKYMFYYLPLSNRKNGEDAAEREFCNTHLDHIYAPIDYRGFQITIGVYYPLKKNFVNGVYFSTFKISHKDKTLHQSNPKISFDGVPVMDTLPDYDRSIDHDLDWAKQIIDKGLLDKDSVYTKCQKRDNLERMRLKDYTMRRGLCLLLYGNDSEEDLRRLESTRETKVASFIAWLAEFGATPNGVIQEATKQYPKP